MTKVTTKLHNDVISKHGRHVNIQIVDTDDELLNNFLKLPKTINKRFEPNTSIEVIMATLESEVEAVINSAKNNISTNKMVGKELIFNV